MTRPPASLANHRCLAILVAAGFAVLDHANAATGDLDTSFGSTGKVTTVVGATSTSRSVALLGDGTIVVVGDAYSGTTDFGVARYTADGNLDASFNGTGTVITPIGSSSDSANTVAIQSDGKIVVAGSCGVNENSDFALVRYNTDGSLDTTFNGTGKVTTPIGSAGDFGQSLAIQDDGKIVVGGYSSNGVNDDFAVVRYNANGSLDTAFNGTGKVTTPIGLGFDMAFSVAIQADGKIVLAGSSSSSPSNGGNYDFAIVRYDSGGTLDTSFNGTGKVTTDFGDTHDNAGFGDHSLAIQSDGKIIVAGSSSDDFAVVRYNPNGTLDTTFNGAGKVTTAVSVSGDNGHSVALQGDGKIVVAGASFDGVGTYGFAVVRYSGNGSLDATFNGNGKVMTPIGFDARAYAVAVQRDGKIVVTGYVNSGGPNGFAVARYEGVPPVPEIGVEQPAGTSLLDAAATISFGTLVNGATSNRTFTVKNFGGADLTGLGISFDGVNSADFSVITGPVSPVVGTTGSTTFTIRFAPVSSGLKTAVLHIANNDPDENPFEITVTGRGLAPDADDDVDGVTNAAEINLSSLGFDPLVDSTALRSLLHNNALGLGLFRASDMQALALGNPVLERNPTTGRFDLKIGILKSPDLLNWTPLTGYLPSFEAQTGTINIDITPDGSNPHFFRVLGSKP